MTERLLDLNDIAELWRVRVEHAKRHLVKLPDFPQPAPGSTRKNRRWRERDIIAFLSQDDEQPA